MDTLKFVKRFEAVGFERRQAEEIAEVLQEAIIHEVKGRDGDYATKGDIRELELAVDNKFQQSFNKNCV